MAALPNLRQALLQGDVRNGGAGWVTPLTPQQRLAAQQQRAVAVADDDDPHIVRNAVLPPARARAGTAAAKLQRLAVGDAYTVPHAPAHAGKYWHRIAARLGMQVQCRRAVDGTLWVLRTQ